MKFSNLKTWSAKAPSNLALIKYAGKKNNSNIPLNASLSYTLSDMVSQVRITPSTGKEDSWKPLKDDKYLPLKLSPFAVKKFLNFFTFLKKTFQTPGFYVVESANNFPAEAGCASSASSFCALTKSAHLMALSCSSDPEQVKRFSSSCLSVLSRQGSGSSCRSFFSPWALWEEEGARPLKLPFSRLKHHVISAEFKSKKVSSSKAHQEIVKSPAFKGRGDRAKKRLSALLSALKQKDWKACFEITWDEFQDLHHLYESAGIFYRNKKSHQILDTVKTFWEKEKDGPLVTMDAGSCVHLLYRPDQQTINFRKKL